MEDNWTYLPAVPDTNRRVLAAYRNYESPVKGFYGPCSKLWFTFEEDIDILQDHVYAWRELPKLPPLPEIKET